MERRTLFKLIACQNIHKLVVRRSSLTLSLPSSYQSKNDRFAPFHLRTDILNYHLNFISRLFCLPFNHSVFAPKVTNLKGVPKVINKIKFYVIKNNIRGCSRAKASEKRRSTINKSRKHSSPIDEAAAGASGKWNENL